MKKTFFSKAIFWFLALSPIVFASIFNKPKKFVKKFVAQEDLDAWQNEFYPDVSI